MAVVFIFLYVMNTLEPIYIIEYGDRLVFYYEHFRKRTILFTDIQQYEYPYRLVRERNVSAHRITLRSGKVIVLHDAYPGLPDFARRWQADDVGRDDGKESRYVPQDGSFSFVPGLRAYISGQSLAAMVLYVCSAVRIFSGASSVYTAILLAMGCLLVYFIGMGWSRFYISGGYIRISNSFVRKYNHAIRLDDVGWVSMQGTSFHVRMKDGSMVTVLYNLSRSQRKAFAETLGKMGIVCVMTERFLISAVCHSGY